MEKPQEAAANYTQYIVVGGILGVVTLIELWAATLPAYRVPALLILTVIKAALVVLYYMHLKFDSRLYSVLFAGGIFILAIPFTIVLMLLFYAI